MSTPTDSLADERKLRSDLTTLGQELYDIEHNLRHGLYDAEAKLHHRVDVLTAGAEYLLRSNKRLWLGQGLIALAGLLLTIGFMAQIIWPAGLQ